MHHEPQRSDRGALLIRKRCVSDTRTQHMAAFDAPPQRHAAQRSHIRRRLPLTTAASGWDGHQRSTRQQRQLRTAPSRDLHHARADPVRDEARRSGRRSWRSLFRESRRRSRLSRMLPNVATRAPDEAARSGRKRSCGAGELGPQAQSMDRLADAEAYEVSATVPA